MFFFSSRRRHTRLVSDWSSDVCSSDLGDPGNQQVSINRTGIRNRNHPSTECHGGPEECDARSEKKGGPLESAGPGDATARRMPGGEETRHGRPALQARGPYVFCIKCIA